MKTIEYKKIEDLIQKAAENSLRISDIILEDQSSALEETKEQCFERMQEHLNVMLEAIEKGTNPDIRSTSGLTGGDAYKIYERSENGKALCGPLLANGIRMAMAVSELNTSILLFSVRSGAVISMPGMMDTILNLGLNDQAVIGLSNSTQNSRFAYDSYRR